ncbi:tetratricopeptide repeat protein [Actinoplanes sp. NPDC026623]|uniref:tetratricopeptide repeat protein n=1 Tax=Actinoplanes sp. NPDC026623 TaxID=3155610 RepID=UPI0033CDFDE8
MARANRLLPADHAASTDFGPYTWQLAEAAATFLYRQGLWNHQINVQRQALRAAARHGATRAQGAARIHLARTHIRLRQWDEAETHLQEALDLYRTRADPNGHAQAHHYFGLLREQRSRYQEAIDHGEHAVAICRTSDLRHGLGHTRPTPGTPGPGRPRRRLLARPRDNPG